MSESLQIGDFVVMNGKYPVKDIYQGRIFQVTSEIRMVGKVPCVHLEGKSSVYAVDGLTKVKLPQERALKLNVEDKMTLQALRICAYGFCKSADGNFCPLLRMKGSCAEIMATRATALLEKIAPGITKENK